MRWKKIKIFNSARFQELLLVNDISMFIVLQKDFPIVLRAFVVCYGKAVWSSSLFKV